MLSFFESMDPAVSGLLARFGIDTVAMVALIFGLSCFLREVYLATHSARIDPARFG